MTRRLAACNSHNFVSVGDLFPFQETGVLEKKNSFNTLLWIENYFYSCRNNVIPSSWSHNVSHWLYLSWLVDVKNSIFILWMMLSSQILLRSYLEFWIMMATSYHDVTLWRYDVTKLALSISACKCARKLINFCFYGIFCCWVRRCYRARVCMMTSHQVVASWYPKQPKHIPHCNMLTGSNKRSNCYDVVMWTHGHDVTS